MKRKHSSINQNNQLIVRPHGAERPITVDGSFSLDKDNNLFYLLNEPKAWRREYGLPKKIKFKGAWHLNSDYDLQLDLDKTKGEERKSAINDIKARKVPLGFPIIIVDDENVIIGFKQNQLMENLGL